VDFRGEESEGFLRVVISTNQNRPTDQKPHCSILCRGFFHTYSRGPRAESAEVVQGGGREGEGVHVVLGEVSDARAAVVENGTGKEWARRTAKMIGGGNDLLPPCCKTTTTTALAGYLFKHSNINLFEKVLSLCLLIYMHLCLHMNTYEHLNNLIWVVQSAEISI